MYSSLMSRLDLESGPCSEPLYLLGNSALAVRVFSRITTLLTVSSPGGVCAPPPGLEDRLHPDRCTVG